MLDRDFAIVCDRGCDLPPLYIERTQATLVGAVAQTLGTPLSADELTQEFAETYRRLAREGHERIASVHSCASFSPEVLCAREAAADVADVADVRVVDSGSGSVATGMVLFRLACHWANGMSFDQAVASSQELARHVRLLVIPSASSRFGRRRGSRGRIGLIGRATSSLRVRISGERGLLLVSDGEVTQLARSGDLADLTGRLAHAMSSVSACEGPLVYACVETGSRRALRALQKPLDTNEFEATHLGTLRVTPPVEEVIGSGAVGVALVSARDYWKEDESAEAEKDGLSAAPRAPLATS